MSTPPDYIARQLGVIRSRKNIGERPGIPGGPQANQIASATFVFQNSRYVEFDFNVDNTATPAVFFQIAEDINRNYLIIQNNSAAIMYVSFTGATGAFTTGLQIPAGQCYEPNVPPRSGFAIAGLGAGVLVAGSIQ